MKILSLSLVALIAAFNLPGLEARPDKMDKLFDELDLSADQKEQIDKIRADFKQEMKSHKKSRKASREKVKEQREALKALFKSDASDSRIKIEFRNLQKLNEERHEARAKAAELRFEHSLKIRKVLSPEQRQEFRGFMREKRKGRGWRGKKHRRHD